ncbi:hypothetical protein A3D05_06650 [Candidatus Gottesmanbacteria bacterium RIFCSPHIGHO2_02_FULL_40_24]|uniref:Uncharacterized protein n=1 Tax=Candidatus Gottesmanbacteria bacterium RIFCSPHIGHO2_01_FULL_40_15 TaxID=1798376 RepID=A0A1F5Z3B7_9BACT|nr:MAG: hypothetical protein A2777_03700 [Candidatus Gottesmanbacteria bacterium RIFCSPHIGHO2_01_FULL_40_15]OGG17191.1 MAG: hypothetical protein A3D05_06650 [Candidatus Gottesmanbacteria bacterium RIFCSPHIGHO2_02_FULL_40_24]OGG22368.1 MAG: hypothetical protein A3B48_02580 [Candidatus Gottesmanbacteria bacterium RIFCSPLOWO2_01_FULL_40_10]OGG23585.1 MAG: hypothetical protein A3E42_05385 [Candidatus Gottesmanbacteria bacterium RIFCSPHIGHO2_12_FULL_40_13]OGG32223.1 MAG: hypothetical protein A3I80_0
MKDFLKYLLSLIVNQPEDLTVDEIPTGENAFQYNITAAPDDIGKIIGKDGKIIQAVRQTAKILAVKLGVRIRIQLG